MQRKKAKIGDILEVKTPSGFAYLQYTHEQRSMGALVRVLPGLYATRPLDFADLARQKELYFTFYTLDHAVRKRDAQIVSQQPIPDWAKSFPMMRASNGEDATGKTLTWMVVRADTPFTLEELRKAPKYKDLTPELAKLSIDGLWPHALIVKRIAEGWTPERAEEFRLKAVAEAEAGKRARGERQPSSNQAMRHYLYFPKKTNAETASQRLREKGLTVDVRMGADGKNWLTFVTHQLPQQEEEMERLREEMEALAAELNGEYDGWELAV